MVPIFASCIWTMAVMVTAGMAVMAMVGCQFHMASLDQTQASLPGHHRAASSYAAFDLHCIMAVLPTGLSLVPLSLAMPYATDLPVHPEGFAFPPFIPPRVGLVDAVGSG
jgi:hypothetical protein